MRIKYTKTCAGPDGVFQPGQERDLDTPAAKPLIEAGAAVQVTRTAAPEPEPKTKTTDSDSKTAPKADRKPKD